MLFKGTRYEQIKAYNPAFILKAAAINLGFLVFRLCFLEACFRCPQSDMVVYFEIFKRICFLNGATLTADCEQHG